MVGSPKSPPIGSSWGKGLTFTPLIVIVVPVSCKSMCVCIFLVFVPRRSLITVEYHLASGHKSCTFEGKSNLNMGATKFFHAKRSSFLWSGNFPNRVHPGTSSQKSNLTCISCHCAISWLLHAHNKLPTSIASEGSQVLHVTYFHNPNQYPLRLQLHPGKSVRTPPTPSMWRQ